MPTRDRATLFFDWLGTLREIKVFGFRGEYGPLPSIPLSFSLATILPPEPRLKDFSSGAERVIKNPRPIPSRHRLLLRLQRYLIVFDPLTFVLDQ